VEKELLVGDYLEPNPTAQTKLKLTCDNQFMRLLCEIPRAGINLKICIGTTPRRTNEEYA
jgi:hypothetical protein